MNKLITYFETDYWKVNLNPNQAYLGYSVIILKSGAKSMSKITKEEWVDLHELIKILESAYKKTFKATMFNWACLMNNAYKRTPPDPIVHWHFIPRYRKKVKINGEIFEDLEFAHHYNKNRKKMISEEVQKLIIKEIKKNL